CGDIVLSRAATAGAVASVSIGLRPEHLSLCEKGTPEALSGQVVHKENLGADIYLHVSVLNGSQRLVVRVTPHEGQGASFGQTVHIMREHGQALVFGKDGKRLDLKTAGTGNVAEVA
ncbi:MAG: TOBE domain-containing protein, partial [Pseudomonadota bacterium]